MKTLLKAAMLASTLTVAPTTLALSPAMAQSKTGIAVANFEVAIAKTNAYQTAMTQMKTTYASDISATNARAEALNNEMKPLVDAYNTAVQKPGATADTVRPAAEALQRKRAAGQQELGQLQRRVTLATAYVEEQIGKQLETAVKTAMRAQKVDLVLQPGAVMAREPYVDMTDAIVAELNKLVPSVSITPPAGWQPGQEEEQAAAPAAAAGSQPASR